MKLRPPHPFAAIAAVVLSLTVSSPASAEWLNGDTVTLYLDKTTNTSVAYTLGGEAGSSTPGPYFWQTVPASGTGSPVTAFCIQLDEIVAEGNSYVYGVVTPIENAPTVGTKAKADALTSLYGNYYKTEWENPTTANDQPSYKAFQMAVWEILVDGAIKEDGRFATGDFRSNDPGAQLALAQTMLDIALGNIAEGTAKFAATGNSLVALVNPVMSGDTLTRTQQRVVAGSQDLLVVVPGPTPTSPIPAPPAVVLAGIGLCAIGLRARRATA